MKNILLSVLLGSLLLNSCRSYTKAENLKKGSKLVEVEKFENLFPKPYHTVGYLRGVGDDYIWMSASSLYDRYVIKFSFPLKSPYELEKFGQIRVVVNEMNNKDDYDGSIATRSLFELTQSQWEKVKVPEDLFILAKIKPKKNSPVKGFDTIPPEHW